MKINLNKIFYTKHKMNITSDMYLFHVEKGFIYGIPKKNNPFNNIIGRAYIKCSNKSQEEIDIFMENNIDIDAEYPYEYGFIQCINENKSVLLTIKFTICGEVYLFHNFNKIFLLCKNRHKKYNVENIKNIEDMVEDSKYFVVNYKNLLKFNEELKLENENLQFEFNKMKREKDDAIDFKEYMILIHNELIEEYNKKEEVCSGLEIDNKNTTNKISYYETKYMEYEALCTSYELRIVENNKILENYKTKYTQAEQYNIRYVEQNEKLTKELNTVIEKMNDFKMRYKMLNEYMADMKNKLSNDIQQNNNQQNHNPQTHNPQNHNSQNNNPQNIIVNRRVKRKINNITNNENIEYIAQPINAINVMTLINKTDSINIASDDRMNADGINTYVGKVNIDADKVNIDADKVIDISNLNAIIADNKSCNICNECIAKNTQIRKLEYRLQKLNCELRRAEDRSRNNLNDKNILQNTNNEIIRTCGDFIKINRTIKTENNTLNNANIRLKTENNILINANIELKLENVRLLNEIKIIRKGFNNEISSIRRDVKKYNIYNENIKNIQKNHDDDIQILQDINEKNKNKINTMQMEIKAIYDKIKYQNPFARVDFDEAIECFKY